MDLVLSSGFLAFARHAGFLRAVEEAGLTITGVCGTSSGALAGALWAAGMSATDLRAELCRRPPILRLRLSPTPWRGPFSLAAVSRRLRQLLPPTFAELPFRFGVGVVDRKGRPVLITRGSLPDAVAASCCIPWVLSPVRLDGGLYRDGGIADRLFLDPWTTLRPDARLLIHLVDRTAGARSDQNVTRGWPTVRTPASGASFLNLGGYREQFEEARRLTSRRLEDRRLRPRVPAAAPDA